MNRVGFGGIPQVRFNRSSFPMAHGLKTSMNVGTLYPLSCVEVIPGDSFKTKVMAVTRVSSAFLKPVMDNMFMDIYHFFVPYRLCYKDTEKVFGNPNPSAYSDNNLKSFPTFYEVDDEYNIYENTVGAYLGLPPGRYSLDDKISVMPFRAFALIYDKWFRNENTIAETYVSTGEATSNEIPNNSAWSPNNYMGLLPKVGKKKDYFTSCLPSTQKGGSVQVPLGTFAPVLTNSVDANTKDWPLLHFKTTGNGKPFSGYLGLADSATPSNDYITLGTGDVGEFSKDLMDIVPSNLIADLSSATGANVNDVRFAFQLQKMLERDALYGSRYNEYLLAHFGVSSPDSRLQIPEYLGGGRIPLNIQQVAQTSEGTNASPQANMAGYSLSNGFSKFSKGFVEHGFVFTVGCIRTVHTYQQGVPKMFTRVARNDFYDPLFANLGEQPVYLSELYHAPRVPIKTTVFGYNEAWADYRYIPSRVTGQMNSLSNVPLDIWHFADKYVMAPTLSQSFTEETPVNIDRTLAVPSSSQDNFICDFWFDTKAIRVMPTYSVPGLIDHH